jgi:RNA polymerase sigma factor (sigma-70 family)
MVGKLQISSVKKETIQNTDEEYLVRGCQDNDPATQKILYNKYVEQMMILCLRYLTDQEDAKEVLMDGFYSAFRNINSFTYQGEGSLKAWLKKIMVNQCLMHLRKRRAVFVSTDIGHYEEVAVSASDTFGTLNVKEIMKLIQSLPDGYRTVFNLYCFEGKNHKEIAELLDVSESTSKTQLYKAREILKKQITQLT